MNEIIVSLDSYGGVLTGMAMGLFALSQALLSRADKRKETYGGDDTLFKQQNCLYSIILRTEMFQYWLTIPIFFIGSVLQIVQIFNSETPTATP